MGSKPPTPIGRLTYEYEPSELNVDRARAFSEPAMMGVVVLVVFFAFLFGTSYLYQGQEAIGVSIYVIGGAVTAVLLVAWRKMGRT